MNPHALIDLHCDTLTALSPEDAPLLEALRVPAKRDETVSAFAERVRNTDTLDLPGRHFSLSAIPEGVSWCQCCAVFVPDGLSREEAAAYYDLHKNSFYRQMEALSDRVLPCRTAADIEAAWAQGKAAAVLTVENGSVLAGRPERVEALARDGVRMMTLTWNGENEIGSGNVTDHGLSDFGKEAVRELERQGMIADVSHLNDRGFDDFLKIAQKPFAASHSNARSVCGHRRNLPDAFIREMVRREGLIGLTYCNAFVSDDSRGSLDDFYRQVCRFLELGAERCVALGSDYDGAGIHSDLDSVEKSLRIADYLTAHGISGETAENLSFGNAWRFFRKWMGAGEEM